MYKLHLSSFFRRILILSCMGLFGHTSVVFGADIKKFVVHVEPPTFVLPQFTGPYREREASIAPEEYEMAEELSSMLQSDQKDQVLEKLEKYYDVELSPAMLALKGQVYASNGQYKKAEKIYLAVLKRQPQLVRVHSDLAQVYLLQSDFENARVHFSKAVALGSDDALVHGQLAYLNLTLHGAFSAIDGYQRALSIEPSNPQWQRGLLAALTQAKMYDSASALLTEILSKSPNSSSLWLNDAVLALQMDEPERSLVAIEMAMLLGDKDKQNLKTAVQLHLQLGSYDRAVDLLSGGIAEKALDMESVNKAVAWLLKVGLHNQARQILGTLASSVANMSSDDRSFYYLNRAMVAGFSDQKSEEVAHFLDLALEANPLNGRALLDYADFSVKSGEWIKAELYYTRAEVVSGMEKDAMLGRAQLYINRKDYNAALRQLEIVLQKYPEMVSLNDNIDTLQSIIMASK